MSSRFSVALCSYNGAQHICEQLDSLARQERRPDEVILCDDGSTDATVTLAEAFAQQAPFPVQVIRNPFNLGYSRNFAKAISLCSGSLIALCDQDDLWYPQKLSKLDQLFASQPSTDGIFSNGNLIDSMSARLPGDLWGSFAFTQREQRRLGSGQAVDVLMRRNVVTGMAFAFRSCVRSRLASMPASWPHDAWLALMLANEGKLTACSEHLVAYRVHTAQTIGVPITLKSKWEHLRTHGIRSYLDLSRQRNVAEHRRNYEQFHDLLVTYAEDVSGPNERLRTHAYNKARHAKMAADLLAGPRKRRWSTILRNSGAYQSYASTGLKALIRDLFL